MYEGLRTWMGYRASRDPTLSWLLAAALAAAFALALHYAALAWPRPVGLPAVAPTPTPGAPVMSVRAPTAARSAEGGHG